MANYTDETIALVKRLYLRKAKVPDIERETKVPRRTLYSWIEKFGWDDLPDNDDVIDALNRKIVALLDKPVPNDAELNAIDRLLGAKAKAMKLNGIASLQPVGSAEVIIEGALHRQGRLDLPASEKSHHDGKKRGNNDFRGIDAADIEAKFKDGLFAFQVSEWENRNHRRRFYLKSRQIGWTFLMAREALADAVMTGRSKAFLSASKAQAALFRQYIAKFAMEWYGVVIKGTEKVTLKTDFGDVFLYFLSTNSSTAQGPNGDVYLDECFWIRDFEKLESLAGAIASQSHLRKTYFSTPSAKSHPAYRLWNGDVYASIQKHRKHLPKFSMPSAKELAKGVVCVDEMYRKVIDIHAALAGGFDKFSLHQLEIENAPDKFAQLYECMFIDDSSSAFILDQLLACGVADARYMDFKPNDARPFGNREVWLGYDPSRSRDNAEICVLAPPQKPGGKFRVLEKITLNNQAWVHQANVIKALCEKYNVTFIGIDITGPGTGVFERVQEFYPAATPIHYSVDTKTRLVLKAQEVIGSGRIEWPTDYTDIPMAFLAIKRVSTGTSITYVAARDANIGHADAAWAIMHALSHEGLKTAGTQKSTWAMSKDN